MEKHVANQENSQRLFELMPELKTEFWWKNHMLTAYGWSLEKEPYVDSDTYEQDIRGSCIRKPPKEAFICPAPLADEIAELLPYRIDDYFLKIQKNYQGDLAYNISYSDGLDRYKIFKQADTLPDALCLMLIYLLETDLIYKPQKENNAG